MKTFREKKTNQLISFSMDANESILYIEIFQTSRGYFMAREIVLFNTFLHMDRRFFHFHTNNTIQFRRLLLMIALTWNSREIFYLVDF